MRDLDSSCKMATLANLIELAWSPVSGASRLTLLGWSTCRRCVPSSPFDDVMRGGNFQYIKPHPLWVWFYVIDLKLTHPDLTWRFSHYGRGRE